MIGLATTGGTFSTCSCRPATGKSNLVTPSQAKGTLSSFFVPSSSISMRLVEPLRKSLIVGKPQANTKTVRISQGIQALTTTEVSWRVKVVRAEGSDSPPSDSRPRSLVVVQISLGFHTFRNNTRQSIDTMAAPTSTSMGPW